MLCESVWDAGAFGDPGPPVPPAPAAAPWRGWNKRASVAEVIISGALTGVSSGRGRTVWGWMRFLLPVSSAAGWKGRHLSRPLGARGAHTTQGGGGPRALGLEGGEQGGGRGKERGEAQSDGDRNARRERASGSNRKTESRKATEMESDPVLSVPRAQ